MGSGGVLIFSSVQLIIAKFSASLRTNSLVQHCSYYGKYFKNTNSLRVHKYRSHEQSGHQPALDTHPHILLSTSALRQRSDITSAELCLEYRIGEQYNKKEGVIRRIRNCEILFVLHKYID